MRMSEGNGPLRSIAWALVDMTPHLCPTTNNYDEAHGSLQKKFELHITRTVLDQRTYL